jgi:hypothetical protein
LESEKSKVVLELTVNVNVVVLDTEPLTAVTVMVDVPVWVFRAVDRFSVVEQVGLHDAGENVAVVREGRPDTEKETGCVVPAAKVAVTKLDADWPRPTVTFPLLESEKSNDGGPDEAAMKATAMEAQAFVPAVLP